MRGYGQSTRDADPAGGEYRGGELVGSRSLFAKGGGSSVVRPREVGGQGREGSPCSAGHRDAIASPPESVGRAGPVLNRVARPGGAVVVSNVQGVRGPDRPNGGGVVVGALFWATIYMTIGCAVLEAWFGDHPWPWVIGAATAIVVVAAVTWVVRRRSPRGWSWRGSARRTRSPGASRAPRG